MRFLQVYTLAVIAFLPRLSIQTTDSDLFRYPLSLAELRTDRNGNSQYQYPNGTAINVGASSSFDPFENLTLAEGYSISVLGHTEITYYVPILTAAAIFETFYRSLFELALTNFWGNFGPSKNYIFRIGQLQLRFFTDTGPIPWGIIAAFAWSMWQAARRGFTAGYMLQISSPEGAKTSVMMMAGNNKEGTSSHPIEDFVDDDDCDCSGMDELTTDDTLDDYIDDICRRRCMSDRRKGKAKRTVRIRGIDKVIG